MKYWWSLLITCSGFLPLAAQQRYELNSGWTAAPASAVTISGETLSLPGKPGLPGEAAMPAVVPGTVLTTLLDNKKVPDPFYGMNNKQIPDIYFTGPAAYTYWFVKDFKEKAEPGGEVWLQFRGINYSAEIFLNGKRLDPSPIKGMFLRKIYNISQLLAKDGKNRLAVLVHPPDHVGNPNGGQGGDGRIARDLTHQYVAGWDWIQPIPDRNTGIWDKVLIEKTRGVRLHDPHIVTIVPGKRYPGNPQAPATVRIHATLQNPTSRVINGTLKFEADGKTLTKSVTIPPNSDREYSLGEMTIAQPRLWWPNGYGSPELYTGITSFITSSGVTDNDTLKFGIRQVDNQWNAHTRSMQAYVNGQPVFIKGGNWIISDAMLRFSRERYDAEVRFHRDMNLNLIRIWGGALTERPEFYEACDKYGMLVFQDFWFSGDCNGRWIDPMKTDDQWMRRSYPDNHKLVLEAMGDQIRMIRNHPSLAFWCGGNEITPPADILSALKDSLLPALDGTRQLFDYSNSDSMSLNTLGGNGDGPYGIQENGYFWQHRTFPYNSEIGSVGVGDYASLKKFIPAENLVPPVEGRGKDNQVDSVWHYHKYIGYNDQVSRYGPVKDVRDFAMKAQLVNYDQYRALAEGFTARMWDWYTGVMIWKTQNPWTALRGQMYDYYLDVNACLYGLRSGSRPLHIMFNPSDSTVWIANNGFSTVRDLMLRVSVVDIATGKDSLYSMVFNEIGASSAKYYFGMDGFLQKLNKTEGCLVKLQLSDAGQHLLDENIYWLPGRNGKYDALSRLPPSKLTVKVDRLAEHQPGGNATSEETLNVTLTNPENAPVAFFNRVALVRKSTGQRILPTFFDDNYITVMPGTSKTIRVTYPAGSVKGEQLAIEIYGWNLEHRIVPVP
ncbi:glycoside hydrolase family 2 protein [Flavihumibacter petaseus]|uniref:Putative beta-mannosidase n=1 Tax=Flavihumibacter petaseus NBRC 106054 TaxID=1220578 RepID=A0A0E9MZR3_9BACT|nr:glycoside hydrolase family 2 TIM barrel-domain containing protein [Flavihumibacter petaseus]GAO42620.1 putative beta-mannosidase [Flavihumibacter petaseus NBRC 106054]